ncbi:MAG TPA: hypothetical protein VMN39_06145 [Longimicrobiaceae bacterium]|nr:hypothetical protein [Longimicrobiaceae bacterium]
MRMELIAIAATAWMAAGCASTGSPVMTSNTEPLPPQVEATTVLVHNHNWSDIVVYAVRGNSRHRLGMVTSMNKQTFTLPRGFDVMASGIQLMASPIASRGGYMTGPIQVNPGQRVELRLENVLSISNWAVW